MPSGQVFFGPIYRPTAAKVLNLHGTQFEVLTSHVHMLVSHDRLHKY